MTILKQISIWKFLKIWVFQPENITAPSEKEKKSCQGLANKEDCLNTLKDFQNNKTLGNDGLPTEFYLFWPDI